MRTIEFKIYPTSSQIETLNGWMRTCCWIYNRALEHRTKAYKRRKESVTFNTQSAKLTEWRSRISSIKSCPVEFSRDALRRVDRGFQAFFRRVKAGQNPGYPRFRSHNRYNTMECLSPGKYIRGDCLCMVPKLGLIRFKAGNQRIPAEQKLLRIIRKPNGWYVQVLVDDAPKPSPTPTEKSVGIDVGLTSFATYSTGEKIENPRFLHKAQRKLRIAQKSVSRKVKGSRNRRKAVRQLARQHQRVKANRQNFAHQLSRNIVNRFQLIAVEKLNVKGLAGGMLAKSVNDAAWSVFTRYLSYKAASAGREYVEVDPRGTSQTCPWCGAIRPKGLSERQHQCKCNPGKVIDRDHAAGLVIEARALGSSRGIKPVEIEALTTGTVPGVKLRSVKQAGSISN